MFTFIPFKVRFCYASSLLSAICREKGVWCTIMPVENEEYFLLKLQSLKITHVCFSFTTFHEYSLALPLLKKLKHANVVVMCGGVFLRAGGYVDERLFDYICRSEAYELWKFFLYNDCSVFEQSYNIPLEELPLPDYSYYHPRDMHRGIDFLQNLDIIPYLSSTGCEYKCAFCEIQNLNLTRRITKRMKEDLNLLNQKYHPDLIFFLDELLPVHRKEWREQFDGNEIPFFAYIRADIKPEDLMFLINNKLYACAFGIESGNENYRNNVLGKKLNNKDILITLSILREYNINFVAFFMQNTPYETPEIKNDTLKMMQEIKQYGQVVLWEYEHLNAKRFELNKKIVEKYCHKLNTSLDVFYDTLNFPQVGVLKLPKGGFITYQKQDDILYLRDVCAKHGDNAFIAAEMLCRKYGCTKLAGHVYNFNKAKACHKIYKFNIDSHLISKEVK